MGPILLIPVASRIVPPEDDHVLTLRPCEGGNICDKWNFEGGIKLRIDQVVGHEQECNRGCEKYFSLKSLRMLFKIFLKQ